MVLYNLIKCFQKIKVKPFFWTFHQLLFFNLKKKFLMDIITIEPIRWYLILHIFTRNSYLLPIHNFPFQKLVSWIPKHHALNTKQADFSGKELAYLQSYSIWCNGAIYRHDCTFPQASQKEFKISATVTVSKDVVLTLIL